MKPMISLLTLVLLAGCTETFKGKLTLENGLIFFNGMTQKELDRIRKCDEANSNSSRCRRLREKRDKNKTVLNAGVHRAEIVAEKRKMTFKALNEDGKVKQKFEIGIPRKTKLPELNGEIELLSEKTGFSYDLVGELNSEITRSETMAGRESCSWQEPYDDCYYVIDTYPCGATFCHRQVRRCNTNYRTYYGQQDVDYYIKYTDKKIKISMINPSDNSNMGNFEGRNKFGKKVYTYRSQCMGGGYPSPYPRRRNRHDDYWY